MGGTSTDGSLQRGSGHLKRKLLVWVAKNADDGDSHCRSWGVRFCAIDGSYRVGPSQPANPGPAGIRRAVLDGDALQCDGALQPSFFPQGGSNGDLPLDALWVHQKFAALVKEIVR